MRGEVLTGPERRRRWSVAEKLAVVQASLVPGVTMAEVARRHGVTRQQVYDWRRAVRSGALSMPVEPGTGFVEAIVTPAAPSAAPGIADADGAVDPTGRTPPSESELTVEVGLAGGRSLRVPASLPGPKLTRLIRAVEAA